MKRSERDAGFFERASSRFAFFPKTGKLAPNSCEYEWEIGRVGSKVAGWRKFSGPPPSNFPGRLPRPQQEVECEQICSIVNDLVRDWGDRLRLRYSAVSSNRITVNHDFQAPLRSSSVWAIAGSLRLARRQLKIPIGWSGRGTGIEWLRTQAHKELLFLSTALDAADAVTSATLPAVLAPNASAVMLHEAVGHVAEARSEPRAERIGRRLGAECLDISDHSLEPDGAAHYEFDDENVQCMGPTTIVKNGVLVAELHSQATADRAGVLPTGNGRAKSAWDDPIPRVSNLVCAPGLASTEELLSHLGNGFYILRLANGINNGVSVQADIVLAEQIDCGRHTGRFLSGGRIEERCTALMKVAELGSDTAPHDNAMCGKAGQLLFDVGTSAPSLRFSQLRIVAC
jgi:TldD protein